MTLKEQIVSHLFRYNCWVHKSVILDHTFYHKNSPNRYMQNTVDRELRHAEEESFIAVKEDPMHKGNMYKYIPERYRPYYIATSKRPEGEETILFIEPLK